MSNFRMHTFQVMNQPDTTFYANGNQQIRVLIQVLKVNRINGIDQRVPLTQSERNSIQIVEFSENLHATLPAQWLMDNNRNQYDQGLIRTTGFIPNEDNAIRIDNLDNRGYGCQEEQIVTSDADDLERNNQPEIFERFIRSSQTGTRQLMARMTMELANGQTIPITTNMRTPDHIFHSFIHLNAIPPHVVHVNELGESYRSIFDETTGEGDKHIGTTRQIMYHWTWRLPNNLRILSFSPIQRGNPLPSGDPIRYNDRRQFFTHVVGEYILNNQPTAFLTQGRFLSNTPMHPSGRVFDDTCRRNDTTLQSTVSPPANGFHALLLHIRGCFMSPPTIQFRNNTDIEIVDNFGNRHRFRLTERDRGHRFQITRN